MPPPAAFGGSKGRASFEPPKNSQKMTKFAQIFENIFQIPIEMKENV